MGRLVDRQAGFLLDVCKLIAFATGLGYQVTGAELERTKQQAELNALRGVGIKNSKHCSRLAIDLHFYREGKLITGRQNLAKIGDFWEKLGGIWGGRFKKYDDSNHFEAK